MDLRQKSKAFVTRQTKAMQGTDCHILTPSGGIVNNMGKYRVRPKFVISSPLDACTRRIGTEMQEWARARR